MSTGSLEDRLEGAAGHPASALPALGWRHHGSRDAPLSGLLLAGWPGSLSSFQRASNDLHSHTHRPSLLPIRPIPHNSARDSPLTLISADLAHGISVFSTPQAAFLLFSSQGASGHPPLPGKTLQNVPERCFSPSFLPISPLHLTTYVPLPIPWLL